MTGTEAADLCIVGAGISGVNALAVAGELLPPGGKIVVIDRHERVGGMWVTAYPYVRLHQPHAPSPPATSPGP